MMKKRDNQSSCDLDEETLRSIFAASPEAIVVIDLGGKLIGCNRKPWRSVERMRRKRAGLSLKWSKVVLGLLLSIGV